MAPRREFSHRSLHGAPRGRRQLLFGTIFILAIFLLDFATGGSVRGFVRTVGSAIYTAAYSVQHSVAASGFFSRNSALVHENSELKIALAEVQQRAAAYQSLKEENDLLRTMLKLADSSPGVAAPVVSSYHASPYGTFTIAAGSNDGVGRGDLALNEAGFVVGRVTDVHGTRSLVQSIFRAGETIDITIGNAAVSAQGEGGGNARVSVPRGIDVLAGDTVLAPRFGGRPVGIVGKVEEVTTSAEQRVFIVLPANLSLLRFVYVVPAP